MKELVSRDSIEKLFLISAILGPIAGLLLGIIIGKRKQKPAKIIITALGIGAVFSLVYGLWRLYNAITDSLGLDSVLNLGVQIIIFVVFGVLLGITVAKLMLCFKNDGGS